LRAILRRNATCAPGLRAIESLSPTQDRGALETVFALLGEAIAYLRAGNELGFGALADPAGWLERLGSPAAVLAPQELLDAASLLDTAASLQETFGLSSATPRTMGHGAPPGSRAASPEGSGAEKFPLLVARAESLADLRSLSAAIRRAILPSGEISDDASPELKRIRATLRRTRDKIQKTLREILRARGVKETQPSRAEGYITLRNDRFVIPVRASDRAQLPGVVHGSSASGQTLFVEPLETLELNNRLVQLAEDEAAEIARILEELTGRLRAERNALERMVATLAEFDSLFARARFAREFDCALPQFAGTRALRLDAARNPVLEDTLRRQGRAVVPMSLALGGPSETDETVLLISGPNTGGKTVALKTVGLAALAAQSGIPVAAERAELPLFDRILADIGDEQSITADLSTFSAHILNLRAILSAATERSLVLVDEIGTATAPEEGSALAIALLEELRARRCLTLATTHHDRLKAYASATPGVLNAAVEFDAVNLRPTYQLRLGMPGTSSGIAIAERLGLPAPVIDRARAELAPEARHAAELIAYLHRSRDELDEIKRQASAELARLEEERRLLQTEWIERQRRRLAELEQRFNDMVKQYGQEIRGLMGEIRDRGLRAQAEKLAARRMARIRCEARENADAAIVAHLSESQQDLGTAPPASEPVAPERLVPGARVRVRGLGQPVRLRRRDQRIAEVEAGPLRIQVPLEEIIAVVADEPVASGRTTVRTQSAEDAVAEEINVIGCTVEEATRRVDKFLDSAALDGKLRVRIIHGHGTGALRRGLAEFLSAHPLVERFFAEDAERGGSAVTVVELKV